MSTEKVLKEQNDRLYERIRKLEQDIQARQHEHKKTLLESKTKLEFQTNRAEEYEQKYKSILQYKNQQESLQELDEKLRQKQDEIVRLLSVGHEKTQEAQQLYEQMEQLRKQNINLNNDLNQIKQAALSAIMDKDAIITQLTEKIQQLQNNEGTNQLKSGILQLQQKYRQLQERYETNKTELSTLIEQKDIDINQLQEKIALLKDKHEQRTSRLEQDIAQLEKHLEEVIAQKDHEENLEEKYYHTEQKFRRTEKRLFDLQQHHQDLINQKDQTLQKLQSENQILKATSQEVKELRAKIKQVDRQTQYKKREIDQLKEKLQKSSSQLLRKVSSLENQKKLLSDNINLKQQEIERLKSDTEQIRGQPTLSKQKSIGNISPQKFNNEDNILVEKLKRQNKDLQQTNESLKRKVQQQTKQLQEGRQKLLQARGSEGANSQVNKLKVQIEDLNSYLKKLQNEMLMKKITHAEDENFWSQKQKKHKEQIDILSKKYKRQQSELLQRIDRMKKLVPKDKKTDYYQSGFK